MGSAIFTSVGWKMMETFTIQDFFRIGICRDIPELLPNRNDGISLNLGAGNKPIGNSIPLDYPKWDADLMAIPYDNCSVVQIHAIHFLEHVRDPVKVLHEMQRVLIYGGHANIVVPYYNSNLNAQELDHKHNFCEDTWAALFRQSMYYSKNNIKWEFEIHANFMMAVHERNMCLYTQLQKVKKNGKEKT